ncbi:MAG: DUF4142 domain-containing protein, partial [Rhodanobacteraceae bacterium]
SDASVRQFADRMVTDHTEANAKLRTIAQGDNLTMPTSLDSREQAAVDRLQSKSGTDFDRAYAAKMKKDHVNAVALFKHEAANGTPADLQSFASTTLPTLKEHLKMAKELVHETGASRHKK